MAVEIVTVVRVDALTQVGHVLIRSTHIVCVSTGEHAVNMVAGRRPGKHVYLERPTGLMLTHSLGGKCLGYCLGSTGCGKARQADCGAVVDYLCRFLSGHLIECHCFNTMV